MTNWEDKVESTTDEFRSNSPHTVEVVIAKAATPDLVEAFERLLPQSYGQNREKGHDGKHSPCRR
jgi:hypothetical protein